MESKDLQALVVEDEPLVRNLAVRALTSEGFTCECAADGLEAKDKLKDGSYDLILTDLRMPNLHGHALASELLAEENRPVIVILTGLLEPRLVKDLVARGADSVEFKPVDYRLLAAKLRALVGRRKEESQHGTPSAASELALVSTPPETDQKSDRPRIDLGEMERKLAGLSRMLPLSPSALDVYNMTISDECGSEQIAAAIARDPSLSADVLRLANSSFYNPSSSKIAELAEAVLRIGQKRIGELALASSALATVTPNLLPWANLELIWRRSLAAGVAIDLLLDRNEPSASYHGLFLAAILHPLGRITLGTLYPHVYQKIIEACRNRNETLAEQECKWFPLNYGQVVHRVLDSWNIPRAVHEPVRYLAEPYLSLGRVPEPLRSRAELLKLAVFIGQIAVGDWEPWDEIELPPAPALRHLDIALLSELIQQTRSNTDAVASFRTQPPSPKAPVKNGADRDPPPRKLAYCNLSPEPFDFLAEIIPSTGVRLTPCTPDDLDPDQPALINCIWTAPHTLAARLRPVADQSWRLIVTDSDQVEPYGRRGRVVSLSAGYAALRAACRSLVQPARKK